ncbi:translocon-associated protein subunit alpha-like [Convolutriloba macropyga]|uniref:translocon-associated protein subunit alpha-like n=1 Tax=Convolutriloba macropyga TaxID=536237 RepID=UPI003F527C1A
MKISKVILVVALLLTFGAFSATNFGVFVAADKEAPADAEVHVETEDEVIEEGQPEPGTEGKKEETGSTGTDATATGRVGPASDVEMSYILVDHSDEELPAGKVITCLISFRNTGENKHSYKVATIDASLRYPMDFSYYLQNYTAMFLNRTVDSEREATFSYVFKTSERFAGRPFGFVIEANYYDETESLYMHTVLNKTINFIEVDDAFDAEAIMLYVLFGAIMVLIAVIVYYYTLGGAAKLSGKKYIEKGTAHKNGVVVDEWLPAHVRKSPKVNNTPKPKKSKKEN